MCLTHSRPNIKVYIHEGPKKFTYLEPSNWGQTLTWLESYIKKHLLVTPRELSKSIPLRFGYTPKSSTYLTLNSELVFSPALPENLTSSKHSKRKRAPSISSALPSAKASHKFPRSSLNSIRGVAKPSATPPPPPLQSLPLPRSSILRSGFQPPQTPSQKAQAEHRPVLRSGFVPPRPPATPAWTYNPSMVTLKFQQIIARPGKDLSVGLYQQLSTKHIDIAKDWIKGQVKYTMDKAGGEWRELGYIGRGGTKRGIYVRT